MTSTPKQPATIAVEGGYELTEGGPWTGDRYVYVDILSGRLFKLPAGTGQTPRQLARLDIPLGAVAPVLDRPGDWIVASGAGIALKVPSPQPTSVCLHPSPDTGARGGRRSSERRSTRGAPAGGIVQGTTVAARRTRWSVAASTLYPSRFAVCLWERPAVGRGGRQRSVRPVGLRRGDFCQQPTATRHPS
ncbi:hypothetical protein [Streptomyces acidicola]|uniref:hypothetical protein n=1 Tax=Streptomyces acidicola TaxID=2596892 RepID=UPI00382434D3